MTTSPPALAPEPRPWRPPRILLVDDDAIVRETLPAYLQERLRVDFRTAASGDEALRLLGGEAFDIVLADQGMPGMTGLDLMRTLRKEFPEVARVMITGQRGLDLREAAQDLGAVHAFVLKPYSPRWLVKLLQALIDDPPHLPPQKRGTTVNGPRISARAAARRGILAVP